MTFTSQFCDREAEVVSPKYFAQIDKKEYLSTLKVTSSQPVVNAIESSPMVQSLNLSNDFFTLFKQKIDEKIKHKSSFESEYNANRYL